MENNENEVVLNSGIKLSYIKKGQGDTILILHGNRDSKENFSNLINKLSDRYLVVAVDLRGHGKSDKPKVGYQFEKLVADIKEFVNILKIDKYKIIGHSLGASIAMQLAIDDEDFKIEDIVLMSTSAKFTPFFRSDMIKKENIQKTDLRSMNIQQTIQDALRPYFIVEKYKDIEDLIFSNWSNMPPYVHQALVMQLKHPDLTGLLNKIKSKTLVIAGSKDKVTSVDECKQVSDLIPNARLHLVEGCGHFLYLEEEKITYDLIENFFMEEK